MRYIEAIFNIKGESMEATEAASYLLASLLGDAGFEAFEGEGEVIKGYVERDNLDLEALRNIISQFPIPKINISYSLGDAQYEDWNREWEKEGFEPIIIGNKCVVHDGRHIPRNIPSKEIIYIRIEAQMAFGTANHPTTRLMLAEMGETDMKGKRVLDCGTGTGILSIAAIKWGASEAIAYDIDEWSVRNAGHNATINQVERNIKIYKADCPGIMSKVEGCFDIILANINRNILLGDLEETTRRMDRNAKIILSGFYDNDAQAIINKASCLGLKLTSRTSEEGWSCCRFDI